jgi:hypothetical protein
MMTGRMAVHISDDEIDKVLEGVRSLSSNHPNYHLRLDAQVSFLRSLIHLSEDEPVIMAKYQGSVRLYLKVCGSDTYHTIRRFRDKDDLKCWLKKAQARGQRQIDRKMSEPMKKVLWKMRWS